MIKRLRLYPRKDFCIHTSDSVEEINKKLEKNVDPGGFKRRLLWREDIDKPFMGKFDEQGFRLFNNPSYRDRICARNSESVVLQGVYEEELTGTCIRIEARLFLADRIAITIWLSFVFFFLMLMLIGAWCDFESGEASSVQVIAIPFCMMLFGYGCMRWTFFRGLKLGEKVLRKLFE